MIYFLEYSDWDLVESHFAKQYNLSLIKVLTNQIRLPLQKIKIASWQTVANDLMNTEDIFGNTNQFAILADMENLSLKKEDEKCFKQLTNVENIFFYKSAGTSLLAEEKRIWKNLGFEYLTLKNFDSDTKLQIFTDFVDQNKLIIPNNNKDTLLKKTTNYTELLNVMELIYLSGTVAEVIENYFSEDSLPIFMLPFNTDKLASQANIWANRIAEEEIQLGLSLIYGKLEKQNNPRAKVLQKELIQTDRNIKTKANIPATMFWKLFLWKSINYTL